MADQDSEHLRLLSIFHFVVAGLAAFFSLIPVVHLTVGLAMVTGHLGAAKHNEPDPALFGWLFVVLGAVLLLCGLTLAVCLAYAGRFLRQRRRYLYCLVLAGIESVFTPFGTVLGVFTILVLVRPSVKESFDRGASELEGAG